MGCGPALFLLDRLEQTVQIIEVGRIGLHAGHIPADQLDGFVQRVLPPARNEDVSSFVDELLRTGQCHTTCRAGDHRNLPSSFPTTTPFARHADVKDTNLSA